MTRIIEFVCDAGVYIGKTHLAVGDEGREVPGCGTAFNRDNILDIVISEFDSDRFHSLIRTVEDLECHGYCKRCFKKHLSVLDRLADI